ncbi:MAG: hypothetical protein J0I48_05310 [Devosia sp.]|nr:hypothetical protein [Devosia sp. 66-22]MBN9345611.1 hypothetical protein [Devosia sp.]
MVVLLTKSEIEKIDSAGQSAGLASRSETVRQLIAKGLKAEAEAKSEAA